MLDFTPFGFAVNKQFNLMAKEELYTTSVNPDQMWEIYLNSIPDEFNPIYKERREHDCSCCRNFIKNIGSLVSIKGDKLVTVWDVEGLEEPYQTVANTLREYILKHNLFFSLFRTKEGSYGSETTKGLIDGKVVNFNHFWAKLPSKYITSDKDSIIGKYNTNVDVITRSLSLITTDTLETISDLIKDNNLYKGAEYATSVKEFYLFKKQMDLLDNAQKALYIATQGNNYAIANFKNSSIGALAEDLSKGVDIEKAVASYDAKVAPQNYKRSTALVTPNMVNAAFEKVKDLDLENSLQRRHANITDITVNNVIWVDNTVKKHMKGSTEELFGSLVTAKPKRTKELSNSQEIGIEDFIENIVPEANSIELLLENPLLSNLMTITTAEHQDSKNLFHWNNHFAWSYVGNITDSITEKVKQAGGNVDAKLRFSLSWFNGDDLDIHTILPCGTNIFYGKPLRSSDRFRLLDVDMNAGGPINSKDPVENVSFVAPQDGTYNISVNQYSRRDTRDPGFIVQLADANGLKNLHYPYPVQGKVFVAIVEVKNGIIVNSVYDPKIREESQSVERWSLKTQEYVKIDSLMLSPNFWDDNAKGNKHWFFLIEGCKCDESVRGIYTEFLLPELNEHRKVFEVLGNKTKCAVADEQLSGLGFSSTKKQTVTVRVTTEKGKKEYHVKFGN